MLAALFVLGLFGYAIAYTGLRGIGTGQAPGILESLSPGFTGREIAGAGIPSVPVSGSTANIPSAGNLTAGTIAGIGIMRAYVATRWPGRRLAVISTYRPGAIVAGTSSASEHSVGNAADVRILNRAGTMDKKAMDGLYRVLLAVPHCELCWDHKGGCTTSHTDHIHFAPAPCRTS